MAFAVEVASIQIEGAVQQVDRSPFPAMNWDDFRFVLTIARCGSLNAGAAQLGVNVSTASRRLTQVEEALGIVCFVRRPSGIEPTPAGQTIIQHATEIERETVKLMRAAAGAQTASSSKVTITAADSVSTTLVLPALVGLRRSPGAASVTLITDNRILDLHRGEADLALRLRRPAKGGLKIRKISELGYGLYASGAYLERIAAPRELSELQRHDLIGMRTIYPDHPTANWWERQCLRAQVSVRTDRTLDRLAATERDLGIAMLPTAIGDRTKLTRVLANEKLPRLEVFLLAEPSALRIREVREIAEIIATFARRNAASLSKVD